MSSFTTYWKNVPTEEKANTLTHVFPAIATLAIAWPLMALAYQSPITTAYQSPITNHQSQIYALSF